MDGENRKNSERWRARRWLIRRKECDVIRGWLDIDQMADRVGGMRHFEVFSGVKTVAAYYLHHDFKLWA